MVKTIGSKDRKQRKGRSDKGKRRKRYAGKPVKKKRKIKGEYKPYLSKRQSREQPLKLYFLKIDPMSLQGFKNFSRETKRHMRRVVYGRGSGRIRVDAHPDRLSNIENIKDLVSDIGLHTGEWIMMMWSKRRNKFGCSPRGVALITIRKHKDADEIIVKPSYKRRGLKRYWFWIGD